VKKHEKRVGTSLLQKIRVGTKNDVQLVLSWLAKTRPDSKTDSKFQVQVRNAGPYFESPIGMKTIMSAKNLEKPKIVWSKTNCFAFHKVIFELRWATLKKNQAWNNLINLKNSQEDISFILLENEHSSRNTPWNRIRVILYCCLLIIKKWKKN